MKEEKSTVEKKADVAKKREMKTGLRADLGLDESTTPTSIAGGVMQIITGWFRKKR